jgi:hypothetical protein
MYLLGLSQLVPLDKFLQRLAKSSARWIVLDDPVVTEYLATIEQVYEHDDDQLGVIKEESIRE